MAMDRNVTMVMAVAMGVSVIMRMRHGKVL